MAEYRPAGAWGGRAVGPVPTPSPMVGTGPNLRATKRLAVELRLRGFAVNWSAVVKSHAELVLLIALLVLAALSVLATVK